MSFTPEDGSAPMRYTVFDFKNTGGVALGMYNTDKVSTNIHELQKSTESISKIHGSVDE